MSLARRIAMLERSNIVRATEGARVDRERAFQSLSAADKASQASDAYRRLTSWTDVEVRRLSHEPGSRMQSYFDMLNGPPRRPQ